MLILISDAFDASLPEKLAAFGEVTDDKGRLPEADVVLVRAKTKCDAQYIDKAANLKLIIRGGVGIDNIDKAYAESKGIIVANTPKASAIAVAELAMALMLSVPSNLIYYHNGMMGRQWLKKERKRTELNGKTLGIIGIGNVGTEVAKRAQAFGMKVVAFSRRVKSNPYAEILESREAVVADADYILVSTPLTDETRGMVDAALIAKMTRKPVLINTGRALVCDADAVKAALDDGRLSWFCSDVFPTDPVDWDNYPILKSDHVTLTPHVGANSKENLLRIGDEICAKIDALLKEGRI